MLHENGEMPVLSLFASSYILLKGPLGYSPDVIAKVLSPYPVRNYWLSVNVVYRVCFETFPLKLGTDCTKNLSFKMLPLQL